MQTLPLNGRTVFCCLFLLSHSSQSDSQKGGTYTGWSKECFATHLYNKFCRSILNVTQGGLNLYSPLLNTVSESVFYVLLFLYFVLSQVFTKNIIIGMNLNVFATKRGMKSQNVVVGDTGVAFWSLTVVMRGLSDNETAT